jgi:Icc-related predicted phosphoesterase
MPAHVDLLVTHCPPYGILDRNSQGKSAGSEYLRDKVLAMKPKYHVFGHIHESMGMEKHEGITFVNVAMTPTRLLI